MAVLLEDWCARSFQVALTPYGFVFGSTAAFLCTRLVLVVGECAVSFSVTFGFLPPAYKGGGRLEEGLWSSRRIPFLVLRL